MWLAVNDSGAQLKLARFQDAADVAVRGLDAAGEAGLAGSWAASLLAANAAEALLALGRTEQALLNMRRPGRPEQYASLGLALGVSYDSAAVAPDGTPAPRSPIR